MNSKESESPEKLRGGYYTDADIASFLLRWVLHARPKRILEPSCGDGVFLRTLAKLDSHSVESVVGLEIEPTEANKSREAARQLLDTEVEILNHDFLGWSFLQFLHPPAFEAVVGNPPFIRYQYLDSDLQAKSEEIFKFFHLPFTKHTNAWVPFVISSIALLSPGGRLAMVLPAELLHVLHAQSLRTFLTQQCSRILIFDPAELWFENTLQGAILLLAEKKGASDAPFGGIGIIPTRTRAFLGEDPESFYQSASYTNGRTVEGKWMRLLLTDTERRVLDQAQHHSGVYRFDDIAEVAVGIVTGANRFFLVPNAVVEGYNLGKWAYPMFGRSDHVPGVVYDQQVHCGNQDAGLPTNFIWFVDEELHRLPPKVQEYIRQGEAQGLHTRYKCRIREPWYSVPSVYATEIGMLKRSHNFPRLLFNKVGAYTTDTAYRVKTKRFAPPSLVFSFVNSLTALTAELEGRHYGGGVLELVPSEIRKLLIPISVVEEKALYRLDSDIRAGVESAVLLEAQDEHILGPLGFDAAEREALRTAWMRLRTRRQRGGKIDRK